MQLGPNPARRRLLDAPSAVGGMRVGGVPATLAGGSYQALVDLTTADTSPMPIPLLAWDLAGVSARGEQLDVAVPRWPKVDVPEAAVSAPSNGVRDLTVRGY